MQLAGTPIVAYVWKDQKKAVPVVDTISDPLSMTVCSRLQRDLAVPAAVRSYQLRLSGVDRADQFASYYHFNHRSERFYVPLIIHVLETVLNNCAILWRELRAESELNLQDFRESLAQDLMDCHVDRKRSGPHSGSRDQFVGAHFPVRVETRRVCQAKDCDNRTVGWCAKCEAALCPYVCFEKYHTAHS
jgi:hypothetical protein